MEKAKMYISIFFHVNIRKENDFSIRSVTIHPP